METNNNLCLYERASASNDVSIAQNNKDNNTKQIGTKQIVVIYYFVFLFKYGDNILYRTALILALNQ